MSKSMDFNIINATWGGQFNSRLSNNVTFFHSVKE